MGLRRTPRRPHRHGQTRFSAVSALFAVASLLAVAALPGCGAPPKQVHTVENAPVEHVTVATVALPDLPDACTDGCTKTDGITRPLSQEKTIRGVSFTVDMPTEGFEEDTLLNLDNQLAYIEKGHVLSGIHVSFSVFKNLQPESLDDAEKEVNLLGDRKTLKKDKLGDGFLVATTNDKKTSLYVDTWTPANDDYSIHCSAYDTETSEIKNAAALQDWFEAICSSVKSKVAAGPQAAGGGSGRGWSGFSGSGKLPDGWPAAMPVIEGGSVKRQMSSTSGNTTTLTATIEAGDGAEVFMSLSVKPSFMSKGKSSAMISVTRMTK